MKTAIEWLIEQLENHNGVTRAGFEKCIQQAKEIEKEQIIESWDNGFANGYDLGKHNITYPDNAEQYYNETFKSE